MEAHGPKCSANFNKSSKAMESQGAVDMWGRSERKHKLRYVDFVGDGDCSSYGDVVKSKPYGVETVVRKVEYVGHIQKRMGGRLKRKKRDLKGKKLTDGKTIGGSGHLSDSLIDTFQRYYGKALRQNKGDLPGIEKAVKAIWHHYASTEDNPLHEYCPRGPGSWCKWQCDQANGPVVKKSFETHVKAIARVSKQVAEPEMDKAARDLNLMPGKMKPWILLFLVMEHGREEDFNPFMEWCQLFMWTQEKLWTMK